MAHPTAARSVLAAAIAAAFFPAAPQPVYAQENILEEVIVTARRREESLQETPVAVTALNATALREAGVRNLADLNQIAPNIEVQAGNGNAGMANIYIRGIGQRNTGPNLDSGVGIYIDDVYISRADGALLDINDVQSVQVLRGPQGTLFGKNTTGGALVFTSNRPTEEFEGSVEMRVGNYDRFDTSLVLNVPFSDSFMSRLSVTTTERDGYIDNHFDGDEYIDEDRINAIGQLRWLAGDDLTLDLNVNYADTDQTGRPQKCVPLPGIIGWQAELFDFIQVEPSTGRTYDDFCQDAADVGDERDVISDLGGNYEAENKGVSLTAEWEINDNLSLKSISAWRNTDAAQDDELDHTGIPWLHRTQTVHPDSTNRETDQYSQEFQLTGSAFDDRMQYVSGVYWFSETTDDNRAVNFLGPFDPGIGGLFMLNSTSSLLEAENDAWAVFTQVEWAYNDNWRSTVGVRYTDEDRELEKTEYAIDPSTLDANGGFVIPAFNGAWIVDRSVFEYNPGFGFLTEEKHKNDVGDDDTTFMASVQYLIDQSGWVDTGTVYLTYSQGFRSGGISEDDLSVFDPETVDNVEFGFKLDMLDRRLRVNGAVFYSAYDDRQLTTLVINPATNSPQGATINAEESTIAGIELETIWLATPNLELTFNATFNDGDIDEYEDVQISALPPGQGADPGCEFTDLTLIQIQTCPNDRSDENLPRLPEATYFFAAQYNWQTQWGAFLPRIQLSYKEDVEYCFDSTSCRLDLWNEDEQFDLSARVTWASNDGKWVGAIYGSNLTDEDYIIGGSALTENAGVGGFVANPPRMYGAELKYSF